MFKAVVSDLDGTLLNAEHKVSDFTRETVELLLKKGIKFYIATGPNWFVTEDLREYFYNKKPDRTRYPKQITPEEFKKNDFTKIFFLGENHDELLELENEIKRIVGEENISLLFANEGSLEVFPANCDKAKAAEVVLKRDGLTLKDAVSFGDGLNDYELITETGLGFAMGNSIYLLLEKLTDTEVIESNAEDGMAKKLRELFDL